MVLAERRQGPCHHDLASVFPRTGTLPGGLNLVNAPGPGVALLRDLESQAGLQVLVSLCVWVQKGSTPYQVLRNQPQNYAAAGRTQHG
jgi:hypothetical protein